MASLMLFGILVVTSNTAQAQWGYGNRDYQRDDRYRRDDRYGRNGNNNMYQVARQQGYSNGLSTGAADAQRGQSYNPQRSHYWKNGSDGYGSSSYGNRGQFKQVFRDAFVQGYREGYQRYAGNRRGNNGRWGNGGWPW